MGRAMLNSSRCRGVVSKKTGLNSKDLPSSVEVVCYPQQEDRVELKGLTIQCRGCLLSSARRQG